MKIFIAMPCYQGNCNVTCMEAVMGTLLLCQAQGIRFKYFTLTSESLIPRARNVCASAFLKSDCTHMLFVDADIIFDPRDVINMLKNDDNIIAGAYLKKRINYERMKEEMKEEDMRLEEVIEKSGTYATNPQPEEVRMKEGTTKGRVEQAPTGFMMIKREVLLRMIESGGVEIYENDIWSYEKYADETNKMYNFFPSGVIGSQLVSEDYGFCKIANECGIEILIDMSIKLIHIGQFYYYGDPMKKVL